MGNEMSTYYYPGSMANRSVEARETDFRIRFELGLPAVDDGADFLGMFTKEVEDRDEQIVDLNEEIEERDKEIAELRQEIKELRASAKETA